MRPIEDILRDLPREDRDDLVARIAKQSKELHPNAWQRRFLRELIDAIEALA